MFLEVVFLIVLLAVVRALFIYSAEGNLKVFKGKCPDVKKLAEKSKDEIVEGLHDLALYKNNYVYWHRFMAFAFFTSLVILYFFGRTNQPTNRVIAEYIILTTFIFLAIDLSNRFDHTHIETGVMQEATRLYTLYFGKKAKI